MLARASLQKMFRRCHRSHEPLCVLRLYPRQGEPLPGNGSVRVLFRQSFFDVSVRHKPAVKTVAEYQIDVGTFLADYSLVEHKNSIGLPRRRHPVGNDNTGCTGQFSFEGFPELGFRAGVHCSRTVIHEQQRRFPYECAGDRQPLFLSAG